MGATKIEWTDSVWNPVHGCSHAGTPGCDNCYAKRMAVRLRGRYGYPGGYADPESDPFDVVLDYDRLDEPLRWKKPRRVFVVSMGDLFHERVPADFVEDVFEVMSQCRQHTFLVLTKRPQNIQAKLYEQIGTSPRLLGGGDFLPNVWFGVTVENQDAADSRILSLLSIPAAGYFVSNEPLLGPVTYEWAVWHALRNSNHLDGLRMLNWIIVGGETGPGARPMDPQWARAIRDECREAGVPFFFKKMGVSGPTPPDLEVREWPTDSLRTASNPVEVTDDA